MAQRQLSAGDEILSTYTGMDNPGIQMMYGFTVPSPWARHMLLTLPEPEVAEPDSDCPAGPHFLIGLPDSRRLMHALRCFRLGFESWHETDLLLAQNTLDHCAEQSAALEISPLAAKSSPSEALVLFGDAVLAQRRAWQQCQAIMADVALQLERLAIRQVALHGLAEASVF